MHASKLSALAKTAKNGEPLDIEGFAKSTYLLISKILEKKAARGEAPGFFDHVFVDSEPSLAMADNRSYQEHWEEIAVEVNRLLRKDALKLRDGSSHMAGWKVCRRWFR